MGISKEQALDCLRSSDLIGIGMEADAVRRRLHPENVVSYTVDSIFSADADLTSAVEAGGLDSISLSITPEMPFERLEETFAAVTRRFPSLSVNIHSAGAILRFADAAGLGLSDALRRLRDAGLTSFTGAPPEISEDRASILELHRSAHRAGLRTAAGVVFGAGETLEDRVDHLFTIRAIQDETSGFTAFTPWSLVHPAGAVEAPTAVEYMRMLAVARMVLDNIDNVESSCLAQGLKVTQMALRFGANDAGAILTEGIKHFTEEDLRRVIRDAGFQPVERDTLYRTMFLNN